MIRKLLLSQGELALQMLTAARKIAGEMTEFEALALEWDDSFEAAQEKTGAALRRMGMNDGQPILILTDIYGGTPYNVAVTFCSPGLVETVTGVNLPMIVRLGCRANGTLQLHELASWIQSKGQRAICTTDEGPTAGSEVTSPQDCND